MSLCLLVDIPMAGGSYHHKHYRAGPWDFPRQPLCPAACCRCRTAVDLAWTEGVIPSLGFFCWENWRKHIFQPPNKKGLRVPVILFLQQNLGISKKGLKSCSGLKINYAGKGKGEIRWQGGCDEKLCAVVSNLAGKEKSTLCLKFKDWFPNALPLKMGLSHSHVGFLQGIHYTVFIFFWVCTPF